MKKVVAEHWAVAGIVIGVSGLYWNILRDIQELNKNIAVLSKDWEGRHRELSGTVDRLSKHLNDPTKFHGKSGPTIGSNVPAFDVQPSTASSQGYAIYARACQGCHGHDGDRPASLTTSIWFKLEEKSFLQLLIALNRTPPHKSVDVSAFSDEQVAHLATFLGARFASRTSSVQEQSVARAR